MIVWSRRSRAVTIAVFALIVTVVVVLPLLTVLVAGLRVLHRAAGDSVEPHTVLLAQPQRCGEPASGVAVNEHAEATLHIADRAGADTRPVRELLLGHAGRCPELLECDAQRLIGHRITVLNTHLHRDSTR